MSELECLAYGAGQADEGICLLLRLGSYRILLDCGLRDLSPLLKDSASQPIDLVLCTHAHADHARGLLPLHQALPEVPIYASEVTTQLLSLNWSGEDPSTLQSLCQALPWQTSIAFLDGLTAALYPAGHLPGAAAILLTYTPKTKEEPQRLYTVMYTGDFFLSNSRLVEGLPLENLRGLSPDILIVEGTYGTARHPHRRQQENQLAGRIHRAIAAKQSILLPTAPLGLAQELLILLRSHHHFTGRDIDIWVDETIAKSCDAYLEILPYLPASVQNFARHQALFWDDRIRPRVRRLNADQPLHQREAPCIVLTDESADLSQYYASNPDSWLILSSQEPHRQKISLPGDRQTGEQTALSPYPFTESYLLAQHCDGPGTTQLIHNLRPQHVILVHGSPAYLADLTGLEELHNRYQLHTPASGSLVELPFGDTFIQPDPPENTYEGEVNELGDRVIITLSDIVTTDPRWRNLADTGLIEARWQGEELVLRGLPQQELMRPASDRLLDWVDANSPLRSCCGNCRHYRGQRCWNKASPLFEFKVTPDGFCPVFEPARGEG